MRGNSNLISRLLVLVLFSILLICLYFFAEDHGRRGWNDSRTAGSSPLEEKSFNTSSQRTNIFFLKTHKCASSTVQNILMRFGYQRHLNFALPEKNNYLGHPTKFNRSMIPPQLRPPSMNFNIFAHHTRYNHEEIKAVMEDNAAFVTILRDPVDVYEALFSYYRLNAATNMTLQQTILSAPEELFKSSHNGRISVNQMSFDLGFDTKSKNHSEIVEFIQQIEVDFDLVMITEHMEASLVLLCQLMDWPLENVVHFKTNSRSVKRKTKLSPSERAVLMTYNSIDSQLYHHFINRFKSHVIAFGIDNMKRQVTKLIALNSELWQRCVDKPNLKGYQNTLSYDLRNPQDFVCFYSSKSELAFTDEIRNDQIRRLAALKKLDDLIVTGL